mmetsp:Transcript_30363/g.72796  ORF Transcript_30363/g.72796 Transcript_30363/m.72796 type:complete len:223 (+) Transcript_30363:1074-1742(+)
MYRSTGPNVHNLQGRIHSISQNLGCILGVKLDRGDGSLMNARNVRQSFSRLQIEESYSAIQVGRHGGKQVGTDINTIGGGTVSKGGGLFVGLSGNVPDFQGPVGRSRNHSLFGTKEFDTGNLVGVTYQVVDHSPRPQIPNPTRLVTPTRNDHSIANSTRQYSIAASSSQGLSQLTIGCIPYLDDGIGTACGYQVCSRSIVLDARCFSLMGLDRMHGFGRNNY